MSDLPSDSTAGDTSVVTAKMVAWQWPLALLAALVLLAAIPWSLRLRMDRTIDQMFSSDDPLLLAYQELRDAFGGNAVAMLVYRDEALMSPAGLQRAGKLSDQVISVPGVRGVLSVAQLNDLLGIIRPNGIFSASANDVEPLLRKSDVVSRAFERLFVGYTHSDLGDVSSIVVLLESAERDVGYTETILALRKIVAKMPVETSEAMLVGEPVLLSDGFDLIERDGFRLAVWTVALLSPLVWVLLGGFRWVLLQAVVIAWVVIVTRAILFALDMRLSIVSSILTAICTVITVTSVIHLASAWRKRMAHGDSYRVSAMRSLWLVMPAIFWACATDAAGFISLFSSDIKPIRDFAVMMAIASILVWIGLMLWSPLLLSIRLGDLNRGQGRLISYLERTIQRGSVRTAVMMFRYRVVVISVAMLLGLLTIVGINQLKIETSFLKNFHDDSDIAISYGKVENSLRGAGVWDVVLDAPEVLSNQYLTQVRGLEKKLREIDIEGERLTKVLSIADADRIIAVVPLFRLAPPTVRLNGIRAAVPAFSDALLVPGDQPNRKLRIMLRSREHLPTQTKTALIAQVERVVLSETTKAEWKRCFGPDAAPRPGRVTGYYVMIARLVSQMLGDQWKCLALATGMVWLLLIAAARSIWLASLVLIPNLLPVLGVLGGLGIAGIEMNMGAAMVAAVSVGLSIDGSVHFLASYHRKRSRGRSSQHSAYYSQRGIGLPVVMATIALMIGFLALGRSEFVPTATFGILTAAALFAGAIVNLTMLPILVGLPGPSSLVGWYHSHFIHERRIGVLASAISSLLPERARVLDVGCGDGRLAAKILRLRDDIQIRGVDVLIREGTAIEVQPLDGDRLPFADHEFDACLLVDVIHHATNPDQLIQEVCRVSSRYVIVKDHDCQGFAAQATLEFMDRMGNQRHGVAIPGNYFTPRQWHDFIERHRMRVLKRIERLSLYPLPLRWFFERKLHFLELWEKKPTSGG